MTGSAPRLTRHARVRCAQRNYDQQDLALLFRYGTSTKAGVLMRNKDAQEGLNDLRLQLNRLELMKRVA